MSEYIKKIEKDYNDGKISKEEATKLKLDYQKNWGGDDIEELENEIKRFTSKKKNIKTKYEENPELYFRDNASKISDNIESIKKNVQFFFWITMISLIISFLGLIIVLAES